MALIQPKQINTLALVSQVRTRVPVGVTLTVADGFQYVVHAVEFPVQGDIVLQGDGELVVNG